MERTTLAYLLIAIMVAAGSALIWRLRYTSHKQSYARLLKRRSTEDRIG